MKTKLIEETKALEFTQIKFGDLIAKKAYLLKFPEAIVIPQNLNRQDGMCSCIGFSPGSPPTIWWFSSIEEVHVKRVKLDDIDINYRII